MNRANLLKLTPLIMALLMIGSSASAETSRNTGTVLSSFLEPDVHAKPIARMWFPDAAAGEDDSDLIDKQISELAAKGFGGVEVAMLMSNGVKYDNKEARIYGWGTDNWSRLLKKILKAAAKVPGGFQVDITITETAFMSRVQAVLQNGVPKIDLAVLIDTEHTFDFESGNRFQGLLDSGYSYNLISESVLNHPRAAVSDGVLAADGPAYKVLIVDRVHVISSAGISRLAEYARAGLPIILFDSGINRVYGSDITADNEVAAAYDSITGLPNVKTAASEKDIMAALDKLGITAYACYNAPQLESTLYGRTYAEHSGYQDAGAVYGMGPGILDAPDPDAYFNGLLSVRIIPYSAQ